MSKTYIRNELKNRGKSSVLVVLKPEYRTEEHVARLQECFCHHEQAERAMGAGSTRARKHADPGPSMLYLANLCMAYGQVDKQGWERLQSASAALDDVGGAPSLQPITGLGS